MVYTPRVVGTDRPGVQPMQIPQLQQPRDLSDSLLKGASEANVYGYNTMQAGIDNLAKMTATHTENAIARNDSATRMAVTAAQYAGQSQARMAQELGQVSKIMQDWEVLNRQKKEDKIKQEQVAYDRWFNELKYSEGLQLQVYDRQTAEKDKAREAVIKEVTAAQNKHYAEQKAKAFVAVRDVMAGMQQDAYTNNPLYVRNKLLDAIKDYDLRPEDIPELLAPGYEQLTSIDKEQFVKRQDYADKVQTQLLSQQKFLLANKFAGGLARIKTDNSGNIQPILDEMEAQVNEFIQSNPGMGVLESITLQNYALEEANKAVNISADNRAVIAAKLDNNKRFVNELGPILEELNGGGIGVEEYNSRLSQLALKYEIPIDQAKDLGNPMAAKQFMADQMELQKKLQDLKEAGELSDLPDSNLSDLQVGTLAWYFYKHPDQYNAIKNGDTNFNKDPSFLRAEGVMKSYEAFTKKKQDAQLEYRRLEQQQRAFGEDTLRASKAAEGGQTSTDFKAQIEQKMQIYFGGTPTNQMNPEAYATWEMFRRAGNDLFEKQKAAVLNSYAEEYNIMQQYGLHEGDKSAQFTQAKYDAVRKQIDTLYQNARPSQQQPGVSPNFNPGVPTKLSTSFAQGTWKGTPILTPFRAGTQFTVGDGHGGAGHSNHGRNRPHSGLDIAVKSGTPLLAMGNGVVLQTNPDPKGYGIYVDIKLDDGSIQRFGHLQGSFVKPGQRVTTGQVFAKTGSTGRSSGPHLHWEFRREQGGGFEGSIDPISAANAMISRVGTIRPRDDNTSWQSPYNPYGGSNSSTIGAQIPKGANPLWGGAYIYKNKVYTIQNPQQSKSIDTYNRRNFVVNNYMERTKAGFKPSDNNPSMNYHYAVLARDNEFRKAVHKVANNLNVPAVWLADIMAFETGGTFSPSKDNGIGYTGLIQFGDAAASDLGTTRAELAKMSRAQQMQYVERYYKNKMREAGISSIDNIETMLAIVWGGSGLVRRFAKNPGSTANVSDVNTTFRGYLDELGRHGGRKYAHYFSNRRENVAKLVHTKYNAGCPVCNQMQSSGSKIVPHQAQG